jgi:pSer/pThr/pTyr-binding forkhead associated (FHA) protein
MSRIILQLIKGSGALSEFKIFDLAMMRIGRAFDNDLIIDDIYIAPNHLRIAKGEEGWLCCDLGTANGTSLLDAVTGKTTHFKNAEHIIRSGDRFWIGKTNVRFWDGEYQVPPEKILDRKEHNISFQPAHRFPSLWLALIAFYFFTYLRIAHGTIETSMSFFKILLIETFVLLGLTLWAGIWAGVTRFSRNESRFQAHLILTCYWVVIVQSISFAIQGLSALLCSSAITDIVSFAAFFLYTTGMLVTHLGIATQMTRSKRWRVSTIIAGVLASLLILSYFSVRHDFNSEPTHTAAFVPFPQSIYPAIEIPEAITRLDSIF